MGRVIPFILVLAVTIYAIIDCARTPKESLPGPIPKVIWLIGIILLAPLGGLVWIVVSRVSRAEAQGEFKPTLWSSPDVSPEFQKFHRPDPEDELQQEIQNAPDNDPEYLFRIEREIQRRKMAEEAKKSGQKSSEKPDSKGAKPDTDSAASASEKQETDGEEGPLESQRSQEDGDENPREEGQ